MFQQKGSKVFIKTSDNEIAGNLLRQYHPEKINGTIAVAFEDIGQVATINKMLTSNDLEVYLLHPKENDLEQLFIDLTSAQS